MEHNQDTLLFPLFTVLRRSIMLGVDDYLLALDVLMSGTGLASADDLWFTCRTLWAKSEEEQELFDRDFASLVRPLVNSSAQRSTEEQEDGTESLDQESIEGQGEQGTFSSVEGYEKRLPLAIPPEINLHTRETIPTSRYQLQPRLPVSRREFANIWRPLHRSPRVGFPLELDVQATIDSICRNGFFLEPVMQPRRNNRLKLLTLVDKSPSMVPFEYVTAALLESLKRSGLGNTLDIFWTFNSLNFLMEDEGAKGIIAVSDLLSSYHQKLTVIIISDAGAARRVYKEERIKETREFIDTLAQCTHRYVWVNPLPTTRWENSSAMEIAQQVPMFSINRPDLLRAVEILRGLT